MKGISAKSKFAATMVILSLVAIIIVGWVAWRKAYDAIQTTEFSHLTSVRAEKIRQISNYFETTNDHLVVLSEDPTVVAAMVHFSRGFDDLKTVPIPPEYDESIEAYYEQQFFPALQENISSGTPEFNVFRPRSQPARYLQYHYMTANGNAIGFKHLLDDAEDGSDYSRYHAEYHDNFREFLIRFGFYDLFLIDFETGEIVYSVFKEVDYGTNLLTGPYRNSKLADVTRTVIQDPIRKKVQIEDFGPYVPSYNAPASFIAAPIYNDDHIVGILALQLPIDQIDAIMTSDGQWVESGMGESGETYLIGSDNLMRSNSRFLLEDKDGFLDLTRSLGVQDSIVNLMDKLDTTILIQRVDTEGTRAALGGESFTQIIDDYRGIPVLSSYSPLNLEGLDWIILSEIDVEEVFAPLQELLHRVVITAAILVPLIALLSWWLAQLIFRPLQNQMDNARLIVQNLQGREYAEPGTAPNLAESFRFETDGNNEYGDFGLIMNQILDQVQEDSGSVSQLHQEYLGAVTSNMPKSVSERYRNGERKIIDSTQNGTAVFLSIHGFREMLEDDQFDSAIALLDEIDRMIKLTAENYGVDIFNQLGSEYAGICGLTTPYLNHAERIHQFTVEAIANLNRLGRERKLSLETQAGIDSGKISGVLITNNGINYDIWGDPIFIAQEVSLAMTSNKIGLTDSVIKQLDVDESEITRFDAPIAYGGVDVPIWEISREHSVRLEIGA